MDTQQIRIEGHKSYADSQIESSVNAINIKNIIVWLTHTFSSTSNREVAEAEAHLNQAARSSKFVDNITYIMSQQELSNEVRLAASTYLRRYADSVLNSKNQSSINIMTDRLLRSLGVPTIPLNLKRNIVNTLQHILVKDSKSIIRNAFTPNLITALDQTLRREVPSSQEYEFIVLFGVFMVAFPRYDALFDQLIRKTFSSYCLLAMKIIRELAQRVEESERWLSILDENISLLTVYFLRSDLTSNPKIRFMLEESSLQQLIDQLLTSVTLGGQCFTVRLQSTQYYIHNHSEILMNTVDIARILLSYRLKHMPDLQIGDCNYALLVVQYMQLLYKQMVEFLSKIKQERQTLRSILTKTDLSRCQLSTIRSIIAFLTEMLQFMCLEQFFRSDCSNIIKVVVLPLLELSQEEKEMFMEQPENIVDRYNTLFDYQLMRDRCSDGLVDEDMTIQLTLSHLVGLMSKHLHGWLPGIIDRLISELVNETVPYSQRLQWIILLGILAYPLSGRVSDLQLVKQYLLKEMESMINVVQPSKSNLKVQNALNAIILSKYLIFLKDTQFSLSAISIMLGILNNEYMLNNEPALCLVAIETLYVGLQFIKQQHLSQAVFVSLVRSMERLMFCRNMSVKLYDVILEIFREKKVTEIIHGTYISELEDYQNHSFEDEDEDIGMEEQRVKGNNCLALNEYHMLALQTIKQISNRIDKQIVALINNDPISTDNKLITLKCWNIIRQIVCHQDPTISTSEFLKQAGCYIAKLYRFVGETQCSFDDDVLLLNTWLLKRSSAISPELQTLFQHFPQVLKKNNNLFPDSLFEVVLLFIRYGREKLTGSILAVQMLLQMCQEALFVKVSDGNGNDKTNKANENNPCQAVMIMEQLILHCSESLNQQMWSNIIDNLSKRLVQHQFIKFTFFKSHIVACLALCLFKDPYLMPDSEPAQYIYSKLISDSASFDVSYPIKMLVVCTCEVIKRYSSIKQFDQEKLFMLLRTIICLLVISYERERNKLDNKTTQNEDDSQVQVPQIDEENYQISVKLIQNVLTNVDEYEYFRKSFSWLQQHNLQCYNNMINMMTRSDQEDLKRISGIRLLQTGAREIVRLKRN